MSSRNKKSIEKIHIEYFKECCKEFPSCIHIEHDENPDFLCKHSSGVLGIEHTQLFKITKHPNAPQALESFRKQIVESAQKCCENDIPPLYVSVWFYFNQVVPKNRKLEIERISQILTEFVIKWHQENPLKRNMILKWSEVPDPFCLISIIRTQSRHDWAVNHAAHQVNFPIEKIQSCINEKNNRYEDYIKRCDECWLLIAVDIFRDSQSFEIPNRIDHRFESKFERVYYMDASHRKYLRELPIIRI